MDEREKLLFEAKSLREQVKRTSIKHEKLIDKWENRFEISKNEEKYIQEATKEFKRVTNFNQVDISFLALATGLQILRWWLIDNSTFRFEKDQDTKKYTNRVKKRFPQSQQLFDPVPYDAFRTGGKVDTGLSGLNHRVKALAHDPLIGWVVGPTNILTQSVTLNEFPYLTYDVEKNINGHYYIQTSNNILPFYIGDAIILSLEDPEDLVFALLRHGTHLATDAFTKYGLPIPILNQINPSLSLKLQKEAQIDFYSLSRSILLSTFIDKIISFMHSFFYDEKRDKSPELYNVKSKKIITYSNTASSITNVLTVNEMYQSGNPDALKKLDLGGIIKAIYQLTTNPFFIQNLEVEFVTNHYKNILLGEGEDYEYN